MVWWCFACCMVGSLNSSQAEFFERSRGCPCAGGLGPRTRRRSPTRRTPNKGGHHLRPKFVQLIFWNPPLSFSESFVRVSLCNNFSSSFEEKFPRKIFLADDVKKLELSHKNRLLNFFPSLKWSMPRKIKGGKEVQQRKRDHSKNNKSLFCNSAYFNKEHFEGAKSIFVIFSSFSDGKLQTKFSIYFFIIIGGSAATKNVAAPFVFPTPKSD